MVGIHTLHDDAAGLIWECRDPMPNIGAPGDWIEWRKPSNLRATALLHILCIGSGSGGAGGFSRASGSNGGGGCGGQGAGAAGLIIPAGLLPATLYVQTPAGGAGSPANTDGNQGRRSFVCTKPNSVATADVVLLSNQTSTGTIGAGTGAAGGAAGVGGATTTATQTGYGIFGALWAHNHTNGGAGGFGSGTAPLTRTVQNGGGFITCGGAGGAGVGTGAPSGVAGGDIVAAGPIVENNAGGAAGAGAGTPGGNGAHGWLYRKDGLWVPVGGAGGGSSSGDVGGNGGNGAPGCGGGGGGSGTTGGSGGDGGPGYVRIAIVG